MATDLYVGKRLSFDGQLCTVRYRGEVKGTKGEWLGVEWDDPTRGKHPGEHGGTRYFKCLSKQPTAGSFLRPNRKSDLPRSFVEALKAKYASEDFEDPDVKIVFATQKGKSSVRISGKEVEEVGFDKIRKKLAALSELKIVILDGLCMERPIARKGEGHDAWPEGLTDVKDACPKAIELDLSRNLFEEWREIASICEQLPNLKGLRVDGTRFRDTTLSLAEKKRCHAAFAAIKTLKLENTLLSWPSLTQLTHLFPSLTAFIASQNLYTTLTQLHIPCPTIKDLSLEENLLTDLSALQPLVQLPELRRLVLKSNNISAVATPTSAVPVFSEKVTEVDLSYNEITSWSFIDALQHTFPGLTSLRISHNPLFTTLTTPDTHRPLTPEDGYMLVLARLPLLQILNYSPVLPKERLNAESYYLSLIAKELASAPMAEEEAILKSHPRWKDLCEEYGEPAVRRVEGGVNPNSLAARLMCLRVYRKDAGEKGEKEIEVPKGATAYTVLGVVSKEFGVKPRMCRLVWETGDWMPAAREEVDEDDDWDSGSESGEEDKARPNSVMREVEIVPGTRSIGTWIEGNEATVRLEVK
ncbi:hypothetical protein P280DRAFT_458747 [Massarina eburnea CBS 473.64]|uniref:CAP-Gly domain-containing protein n=1 Tax=Massarina eburnea CBS 473.64 TaxID=1395130 RepID=A0A6A6RNZ3_9PLEO|nr:hypothetical protein P280DRAFT_458747 [Massarina eburnea CBS 473.64]